MRWRRERGEADRHADGRALRGRGVAQDVTAIEQAEAELVAERDLLQAVLDHLPDAVDVKDAAHRFVRLNRATADELADVLEQVRAGVGPQAAAKGLDLHTEGAAGLPPIVGDPQRLRQILINLVGNAVTFTESGRVARSARLAGNLVEVAVADAGIGIAPEALRHVFDEFRQADSSTTRRSGGSGLGLSFSRRLVDLHGGTLRVERAPRAGSTFTVALPAAVEAASGQPPSASRRPFAAIR